MLFIAPFLHSSIPLKKITLNPAEQVATVADGTGTLSITVNTGRGCRIGSVQVHRRQAVDADAGMWSGIKVGNRWYTSVSSLHRPKVSKVGNQLLIRGIEFGGGGIRVAETWTLSPIKDSIRWKIDRTYLDSGVLEDTSMPQATFPTMNWWTGALLGTGGVAWGKLFDMPNATYGVHTGSATLWNSSTDGCLRVEASGNKSSQTGLRFHRSIDGKFSMAVSATQNSRIPKHGKARFLRDREDVWTPFAVKEGEKISATVELKALSFKDTFARGDFKGLDTGAITELVNTIGRIGVIDDNIVGSNGWYSGYAVLHEPWLARVGATLDDPNYLRSNGAWLDYARDHAISKEGMVKSRWCYTAGDAQPGTYDPESGFYEAQWGRLMDTQSSYVTNVADQFDLTGDQVWVSGQKKACESALDYLLKRDSNGNSLVEMENSSYRQRRSSDWLDIVWASYENALVNAQLYGALLKWSAVERLLGDTTQASRYSEFAARLKSSFNKPISEGGFWDPEKGWYVYWREADGSVHGNNLTIPVNLSAIAEGICDDPVRQHRLLATIESKMQAESLLAWPACFESFAQGEGADDKFPTYENGDIFLAWAEYGVRAFSQSDPKTALKYVRRIVDQYKTDGLAFQRYLRASGKGAGDDILANNCSVITGLYRDIYGIQPKFNRLYLEPHLVPELNSTRVDYNLRGQRLRINLSVGDYEVTHEHLSVRSSAAFGVEFGPGQFKFFSGSSDVPAFNLVGSGGNWTTQINEWAKIRRWSVQATGATVQLTQTFIDLEPGTTYRILASGKSLGLVKPSHPMAGYTVKAGQTVEFTLVPTRTDLR